MNSMQINAAATGWLRAAGQDLLNRIRIQHNEDPNFDRNALLSLLNIEQRTLENILHGDLTHITSLELIKLFVTMGLALDIKPIEEAIQEMRNERRNRNSIPVNDIPQPSDNWRRSNSSNNNRPNPATAQPRDRFGRFTSRRNIPVTDESEHDTQREAVRENSVRTTNESHNFERETNPYEAMSMSDLKNIIAMNLWVSEIDLNTATHDELVDFILEKERQFADVHAAQRQFAQVHTRRVDNENNHDITMPRADVHQVVANSQDRNSEVADFVSKIAQLIQSNPNLSEQIARMANH